MVVGKHKTVWRYHNARAITREVNYCVLQGVLAIVELIISHLETFLLHNVVNSIRQVVDCPHTLVSMCGVESAECHHRSDKDCCFFLHYLFFCFYYDVIIIHFPPFAGPSRLIMWSSFNFFKCFDIALRLIPIRFAISIEEIEGLSFIIRMIETFVFCPPFLSTDSLFCPPFLSTFCKVLL